VSRVANIRNILKKKKKKKRKNSKQFKQLKTSIQVSVVRYEKSSNPQIHTNAFQKAWICAMMQFVLGLPVSSTQISSALALV